MSETIHAFKGFNPDLTCRGFQFAPGGEYEEPVATLCSKGFHACEAPLDCFRYYSPGKSIYHEVELEGVADGRSLGDSKIAGRKIKIGEKIDIPAICKAQFEYVKERTTLEHTDPNQATAGERGAATAGDSGAATAGKSGAALSGGKSCVGACGVAVAYGCSYFEHYPQVRGGLGAALICIDKNPEGKAIDTITKIVDGETVKTDTWYLFRNGNFEEVDNVQSL